MSTSTRTRPGDRRVVVTGMAGLSPIGSDWKTVRDALLSGQSAVQRMPEWDEIEGLVTRLAAPVRDFEMPAHYPRKKTRAMGRLSRLATRATELALQDAGLLEDPVLGSGRCGVAYGSSLGSADGVKVFGRQLYVGRTTRGISSKDYLHLMSHTAAANIAQFFGITGRLVPSCSACTSGSQGIGFAYESIQAGKQDVMVAGGCEELDEMVATVFDVLYAASTRNDEPTQTPRPFDAARDGLVTGEGAGTLVLEELERARRRGADIYAEVLGFGTTCDGQHLTAPDPTGMASAMRVALDDAGVRADEVDYINAHATSTERGDIAESEATYAVFGGDIPVSTFKGHMGHTLGACGALETWMAILMMREGWVAPTLNLVDVDERCAPLDYVRGDVRAMPGDTLVTNNFAFGGVNTSLVFRCLTE